MHLLDFNWLNATDINCRVLLSRLHWDISYSRNRFRFHWNRDLMLLFVFIVWIWVNFHPVAEHLGHNCFCLLEASSQTCEELNLLCLWMRQVKSGDMNQMLSRSLVCWKHGCRARFDPCWPGTSEFLSLSGGWRVWLSLSHINEGAAGPADSVATSFRI